MTKIKFDDFHEDEGPNFQLNRFYTYGVFGKEELMSIGRQIDSFEKWISVFTELGEKNEKAGEILKAATCYRAAQFYTLSGEKDAQGNSLKHILYDKYVELYNRYFKEQYPSIAFVELMHYLDNDTGARLYEYLGYESTGEVRRTLRPGTEDEYDEELVRRYYY